MESVPVVSLELGVDTLEGWVSVGLRLLDTYSTQPYQYLHPITPPRIPLGRIEPEFGSSR